MVRPKKVEFEVSNENTLRGTIKEANSNDDVKEYEVIDIKMAMPVGAKMKLKYSVAKQFIEKGYLK